MLNINNKPWNKLRFSDIKQFLAGADDETFFFEFKADEETPVKLIKEVSAFANTYGGYILLGIGDDKSISGCIQWTEQRIHNTIHNCITPIPDFDVKKFRPDGKTIFVIKIEEGSMPPYITNKGSIYERVSSGSFPIKESAKLAQLYEKRKDQQYRLKQKIDIQELEIHKSTPSNLCAYLDLGFEIQCMDMYKLRSDYFDFDFSVISDLLRAYGGTFSISSLGYSHQITLGEMTNRFNERVVLPDASMSSFIEIMHDGSAKCRICLFANNNGTAEIGAIYSYLSIFKEIYSKIFKKNIEKNFIYANKYEKLTVIKQFTPYFDPNVYTDFENHLQDHIQKYGNNIIVSGNRIPKSDFKLIDKRYLDLCKLKSDASTIISELFQSAHISLGYIIPPEV